jgi:hypothetical protein
MDGALSRRRLGNYQELCGDNRSGFHRRRRNHVNQGYGHLLRIGSSFQVGRDLRKLIQGGFQVLGDLERDNVRVRQVRRVLQALVLQPENVKARFVAGCATWKFGN